MMNGIKCFDANLYVANWSAGTVLRFSPNGKRSIFAEGLRGPSRLAISPAGDIYVASYSEDLVWRFTPGIGRYAEIACYLMTLNSTITN